MKKTRIMILMTLIITLSVVLLACSPATTTTTTTTTTTAATTTLEPVDIRIAALKGPTGIGLVKLMADQEAGSTANQYTFNLLGSPDDIVAQISSGQVDIAALPTNLAAVLYQKTNQKIHLLAINTLGVLYILENGNTIKSVADLSGKEIVTSGQGAVPEYVLNEILSKGNLAKPATVTYQAEHTVVQSLAVSGKADLVMLPEPFVTTLLSKNPSFRIALDLTREWKTLQSAAGNNSELSMGCMVVSDQFASAHPEALTRFLNEYQTSVDFVNNDPTAAGIQIAKYKIMADANLASKAIPNCHIVLIKGQDMQPALQPFLQILMTANPKSIGGKLPDDAFYWNP